MTGAELNAWRVRMSLTITQAAQALNLSRGRLTDCLYDPKRPPSKATVATAEALERANGKRGDRP